MKKILSVISSKVPPIFIRTNEERRFLRMLVSSVGERRILCWSITQGIRVRMTSKDEAEAKVKSEKEGKKANGPIDPWTVVEHIQDAGAAVNAALTPDIIRKFTVTIPNTDISVGPIIIFLDVHPYMENPVFIRAIRDKILIAKQMSSVMIFLGPELKVPSSLERDVMQYPLMLPERDDVAGLLKNQIAVFDRGVHKNSVAPYKEAARFDRLVNSCLGLTEDEIQVAFNVCLADGRSEHLIEDIQKQKCKVISDSGLMDFYPASDMSSIGGYDLVKEWLSHRKDSYSPEAKAFGILPPKGLLLLGIQGCGKSQLAKAIAGLLGMSLIQLDIGRMMGGIVGQTEGNIRKALELASRVSPVVLWMDEIEKGLSGTGSSNKSDGGTTARLFSTILTWMNDNNKPVFVIATANDVSALPPELLRKGRFDEIFFVDLPNIHERVDILNIHLKKVARDPATFNLKEVAQLTDGFSGAELEQLVKEALIVAFSEKRQGLCSNLEQRHLVKAAKVTVPLSVTSAEKVKALREFCKTRARPASSPLEVIEEVVDTPSFVYHDDEVLS